MYCTCLLCVCAGVCAAPTSGAPAKDEFSDLVVNKDDETVRECAQPPGGPGNERTE